MKRANEKSSWKELMKIAKTVKRAHEKGSWKVTNDTSNIMLFLLWHIFYYSYSMVLEIDLLTCLFKEHIFYLGGCKALKIETHPKTIKIK